MTVLPSADEQTRQLVELGTFLGAPRPDSVSGDDDDLVAMTADLAARAGLFVQQDDVGGINVVDGVDPEARRRRLWGDFWLEHGIPALPEPDELDVLLDRTPGEAANRLRSATQEVIRAVMAGSRASEMEAAEAPWTPADIDEHDRLSDQLNRLTNLLADCAQIG
ncbi:hypothetical protein [Streptomyces sp. GQFP]|uniref:hypothetical protein n=1 Tax=Streptomyces sp. GQFP TaxID=2907545 RepID=UPI001F42DA7D|nr:hypothetical protein [Streptomyces sp. GQFP]UIX32432.1 hypothetical protein LUX31_21660 [Streptomyces sp. GQFP]